jgi:hypothetical protein
MSTRTRFASLSIKQLVPSALPPRLATGSRLAVSLGSAKPGLAQSFSPSFFMRVIDDGTHALAKS